MGVWVTLYAMPQPEHRLSHAEFTMMMLETLLHGYGQPPVTIMSGFITTPRVKTPAIPVDLGYVDVPQHIPTFPLTIPVTQSRYDSEQEEEISEEGEVTIWYKGDNLAAITQALQQIPYGSADIRVKFTGRWDFPQFYVLPTAHPISFMDAWSGTTEYVTAAHICQVAGRKGSKPQVIDYAIAAILETYYGAGMQQAYTYF